MEDTQIHTFIRDLDVQRLDGEFYHLTRAFLEKHGCKWHEERNQITRSMSQLQRVHVVFPNGTTYISYQDDLRWERYKITLPDAHTFYWNIEKSTRHNEISIPFALLGA